MTDATVEEYRAGVVGGMNMIKKLAQTASPAVFGLVLAAFGFDSVFVLAGVIAFCYAVVLLLLLPTRG